ncbi:thiocillin family RiPP [Planomonospora corallina]|uniref:Thiocillin family RiPP n=1 Tax=Planomonospora corallina TaxID=1806052 RepID=A0ABV8I405_9ACTN
MAHNPEESVDLYAEDLAELQADDLPGDTALASLSTASSTSSASCPVSSASSATTASSYG